MRQLKNPIGKFSIAPRIILSMETSIEIPVLTKNTEVRMPSVQINTDYNPFENDEKIKNNRPANDD